MTALMPGGDRLVPEAERPAHHRVEEALRLPRSGAGGDQRGAALGDLANRAFLVTVEVRDLRWDPVGEVGMDEAVVNQLLDGRTGSKGSGEADVRPPQEGGGAGVVERQELPHLREEMGVGEGIGGELVAEEALRDLLDVGDGVQGHGGGGWWSGGDAEWSGELPLLARDATGLGVTGSGGGNGQWSGGSIIGAMPTRLRIQAWGPRWVPNDRPGLEQPHAESLRNVERADGDRPYAGSGRGPDSQAHPKHREASHGEVRLHPRAQLHDDSSR